MRLASHGLTVDLAFGWEGAVRQATIDEHVRERGARRGVMVAAYPVLHLSSRPLPAVRGDFGSGAVDLLGERDTFIAVLEYGPESLDTPLFSSPGLPRRLRAADFSPRSLQRTIPGQAGFQRFCTEQGRALCLYVVLGSASRSAQLAQTASRVLRGLVVDRFPPGRAET